MSAAIRIGTRGSKLALWQANWVADRLREGCPGIDVVIEIVRTTGDAVQDRPLTALGGDGLFTKELDNALFAGEADVAVHSLKDLPTAMPEGLVLAAVPAREDARDVFIGKTARHLEDLPEGAVIGTGSPRRMAQARACVPSIETTGLRGNIDTRLRKLRESESLDGILLAAAGLKRLGLADCVTQYLDFEYWLPAPGQAALGIVARAEDAEAQRVAALLEEPEARAAVTAERAALARLAGGCHVPIGAYARAEDGRLLLDGLVAAPDGSRVLRRQAEGTMAAAPALGEELAETLLRAGGGTILAALEQ